MRYLAEYPVTEDAVRELVPQGICAVGGPEPRLPSWPPGQEDAACGCEVACRGWRGEGAPDQCALEPAAEQAGGRVVEVGEVLGAVGVQRGEQAAAADAGDHRDTGEKAGVVEGSQAAEAEGGGPEAAAGDRHADAGPGHGHRPALVRRSCRIQARSRAGHEEGAGTWPGRWPGVMKPPGQADWSWPAGTAGACVRLAGSWRTSSALDVGYLAAVEPC